MCPMPHVSMPHDSMPACPMELKHAQCSMPHAPCPMPHAPCPTPHAPCFSAPCLHAHDTCHHAPCPMEHGPKSTCGHQVVSSNPGRPWDQHQTVGSFRESPLYSSAWLSAHLELVGFASTTKSRRAIYCRHTLTRVQWALVSDLFLAMTEL